MAIINSTTPVKVVKYKEGKDVWVPHNPISPIHIGSVEPHRHRPLSFTRDEEANSGNITVESRFETQQLLKEGELNKGTFRGLGLVDIDQSVQGTKVLSYELSSDYYQYGNHRYYLYGDLGCSIKDIDPAVGIDTSSFDNSVPLTLAIYTRDINGAQVYGFLFRNVLELSDEAFEYTVDDDGRLTGNKNYWNVDVGIGYTSAENIEAYGDRLGMSEGQDCQVYFSKYFPVSNNANCKVYSILDGSVLEWEVVSSILDIGPGEQRCTVDKDLGIVRFGGLRGGSALLSEPLMMGDKVCNVLDSSQLPQRGLVQLNAETFTYGSKTQRQLLALERSIPADHMSGSVNTLAVGAVPELGSYIYMTYEATPRLDYKMDPSSKDRAHRLNTKYKPHTLYNSTSIVGLNRKLSSLGSVSLQPLNVDYVRLGDIEYHGPVYFRETMVTIEGQVLDNRGLPLANTETTVYVESGDGTIDYMPEVNVISNDDGKFWVQYIPGADIYREQYALRDKVEHVDGDTHITFDYSPEGDIVDLVGFDLNQMHVYAVMKSDPVLGTVGKHIDHRILEDGSSLLFNTVGWGALSIVAPAILAASGYVDGFIISANEWLWERKDQYINGQVTLGVSNTAWDGSQTLTYHNHNIARIVDLSYVTGSLGLSLSAEDRHRSLIVFIKESIAYDLHTIVEGYYRRPTDAIWDPAKLNGARSVLRTLSQHVPDGSHMPSYTYWEEGDEPDDSDAPTFINPMFNESLVYKPICPVEQIGINTFRFKGELPIPDHTDITQPLGAYMVYGQTRSKIKAKAKNPDCYEQYVYSPDLWFFNMLSPVDSGTVFTEGGYVPYGFRIYSDTYEGASTIGYNTYLTLNDLNNVTLTSSGIYAGPLISVVEDSIVYETNTFVIPSGLELEISIDI